MPGGLYHVTTRGNCRASIFEDAFDRLAFLDRLGSSVVRFEWKCFAYCLMGNHFHLLIETPDPNIARGMRALNGWYAQRFNWRHERTGHLFEAPYHSELVEREAHLLEATRYIVLNPVRAKLCRASRRMAVVELSRDGRIRAAHSLALNRRAAPSVLPPRRARPGEVSIVR